MAGFSDFFENELIDGLFRGGCMTTTGTAGSSAFIKGLWTATTSYAVGDIVVPHANMVAAGGKLLKCVIAQNSGSTNTLTLGNPGSTLTDNAAAMWIVIATIPALDQHYVALFTAAPSDSGGGTEVSGGSYARVSVGATLANWAGTQSTGSTVASSGTGGTTSNNNTITFPAPTANWGVITHFALMDRLTSGNLVFWAALTTPKTVNNLDPAPVFNAAALTFILD